MAILTEKKGDTYKSALFCLRTRVTAVSNKDAFAGFEHT